jgi:ABC-type nitrate/sulfonate/bicarbonate transport system permease component
MTRSLATLAKRGRGRRFGSEALWLGAGGILAFAALWQLLPTIGVVNPSHFPPFSAVIAALFEQAQLPAFWTALGYTVLGWLIGLLIAMLLGVVLGIAIGSVSLVDRLLSSTIEFLRPIPSVALVPIAALLFGATMQATLLLVVFASLWPILIQVIYGVRDVDRVGLDTAKSYRLGLWRTVRTVIWPSIMPYLLVGIRLSAAVALILEITGELVIGSPGIGKLIVVAQSSAATANMYGFIVVAALLGVIINVGTRAVEGRLLFWHASVRKGLA